MKLFPKGQTLQRKVIAAIVMVGLLPLTLSLVLTYVEERRALQETTGANFKEIAVEAARRIESQVLRGGNEAQQLAATPFLRTAVTEANRSYEGKPEHKVEAMIRDWQQRWRGREHRHEFPLFINRLVTNYLIRWHDIRKDDYVAILVTDNRGALVVSSVPQAEYYYGKTAWWQATVAAGRAQLFISELTFEPAFGTHVLNVSVPIIDDEQRKAIGVVSVLLRRDTLFRSISEVAIGTTGHAMLMSSDGTPLICPVLSPEEHMVSPAVLAELKAGRSAWFIADNDTHGGRHSIVGVAPVRFGDAAVAGSLGGRRWLSFVRQDPAETYAALNELIARVVAYGAVVFAVLCATGVLVARRLVRPIQVLHEGAQRIGSGSLDHRLTLRTGDEIEHLADAFNRMAGNLKHSFSQLEERTREIESTKTYLENLLEHANDVIYTLDTEQRFTYVNNKVEQWGYRKDELIGRPYLSLLSKRHRGRRLKSTLDIGAKHVHELELMSKSGEARTVMVSVSPLTRADGTLLGVLGIARDITAMRKLEQQIRNSEKLASIGKLAAGVAHEINNPLGGILNCLYNFRKGTLSRDRQEEYLLSMEDGLRRVQKIVRQLLDFSQQHDPELAVTDLNAIAERVLLLTSHTAAAAQVTVEKRLAGDLPPVLLDAHMIEQVLMNLVLNAIQAIRGAGTVRVVTRTADDRCVIEVEDTGCGIPANLLPRIFDPFFTTKGTGEGTGLGLSVSLGIVERHGGELLVESEVGKGSTFTVLLPLVRDRAGVAAPAAGKLA
jgi:PAS domain S-box-containing protein